MTVNIDDIIFSSTVQPFQNSTIVEETFSIPAHTFSSGNEQIVTNSIPLANGENVSQVRVNFSFNSSKWFIVPVQKNGVIVPSSKTHAQVFSNYDGTNLNIIMRIVPGGASPWSYNAFTMTVNAKVFITPS